MPPVAVAGYKLEAVVDDAQDSFVEQVQASFERLLAQGEGRRGDCRVPDWCARSNSTWLPRPGLST